MKSETGREIFIESEVTSRVDFFENKQLGCFVLQNAEFSLFICFKYYLSVTIIGSEGLESYTV